MAFALHLEFVSPWRGEDHVFQRHDERGPGRRPTGWRGCHFGFALDRQRGSSFGVAEIDAEGVAALVATVPFQREGKRHAVLAGGEPGGVEVVKNAVEVEFSVGCADGAIAYGGGEYPHW